MAENFFPIYHFYTQHFAFGIKGVRIFGNNAVGFPYVFFAGGNNAVYIGKVIVTVKFDQTGGLGKTHFAIVTNTVKFGNFPLLGANHFTVSTEVVRALGNDAVGFPYIGAAGGNHTVGIGKIQSAVNFNQTGGCRFAVLIIVHGTVEGNDFALGSGTDQFTFFIEVVAGFGQDAVAVPNISAAGSNGTVGTGKVQSTVDFYQTGVFLHTVYIVTKSTVNIINAVQKFNEHAVFIKIANTAGKAISGRHFLVTGYTVVVVDIIPLAIYFDPSHFYIFRTVEILPSLESIYPGTSYQFPLFVKVVMDIVDHNVTAYVGTGFGIEIIEGIVNGLPTEKFISVEIAVVAVAVFYKTVGSIAVTANMAVEITVFQNVVMGAGSFHYRTPIDHRLTGFAIGSAGVTVHSAGSIFVQYG